jgi:hypothetical protein
MKTAAEAHGGEHDVKNRRRDQAITSQRAQKDASREIQAASFNSRPRRNAVRKSRSTSAKFFPAIDGRATSTRSTGCARSNWCKRNASRNSLRARERCTDSPTFRPVITPSRVAAPAGRSSQLATRHPLAIRFPCVRARAKSRPCLIRLFRANPSFPSAPMNRGGVSKSVLIRRGSTVCAQHAAGWTECRARSWLSHGHESRVAVCGGFWMVDIAVS